MVTPRELSFQSFDEVLRELDRLQTTPHDQAGKWNLAQTCDHLAYFIEGTLDGHPYRVPWLLKVLFGRFFLNRILKQRRMKAGVPTPQKPLPAPGGDLSAAVNRLKQAIGRLQTHQGVWHDSPFFGHLTPEQWRELHLIHCGHHLQYLVPR